MDEEIKAIKKNNTQKLTTLSEGHKFIGVKQIYKKKKNVQGYIKKYKTRFMAKGYKQQASIDYNEVLTQVTHMKTIRLFICIAA